MTEAQKQLLRMGLRNVDLVQTKLRELRELLGWPASAPAVTTAELEVEGGPVPAEPVIIADAAPVLAPEPVSTPVGAAETP